MNEIDQVMPTSAPSASSIGTDGLYAVIATFRDALALNRGALNRLNVYPVPDGDTGTNMSLTLESVVAAVGGRTRPHSMVELCTTISKSSLLAARGNSGVILCQILRGLCSEFAKSDEIGANALVEALEAARVAAYAAVGRPVEGTILTVLSAAAAAASEALEANRSATLLAVAEAASAAASAALKLTPTMLPALAAAGVVDAGGAGFCLLLEAFLQICDGRPITPVVAPSSSAMELGVSSADMGQTKVSELSYEVMYLLDAADESIPGFKDLWASIGDSIVVVGGDGLWNCHIHTDESGIGPAIEAAIQIGRPHSIRVTDLDEQVEEEKWVREATGEEVVGEAPHQNEPCETAVVAVSVGDGVRGLFLSYGVQQIVAGGQSMNPSVEDLLVSVQRCPSQNVIVLPNNKNIVAVANQLAALTEKSIFVLPTRSVVEGISAVLQYDPKGSLAANSNSMLAASRAVVAGEVTTAVRDTETAAGAVANGDIIGIIDGDGVVAIGQNVVLVSMDLIEKLLLDHHEVLTVLEGEGSSKSTTRQLEELLAEKHPNLVVEIHRGGQPLYPYIFGLE